TVAPTGGPRSSCLVTLPRSTFPRSSSSKNTWLNSSSRRRGPRACGSWPGAGPSTTRLIGERPGARDRPRAAPTAGTGTGPEEGPKRPADDGRQEARWRKIGAQVEADGRYLLGQGAVIAKRARGRTVWALRYRARHGGRAIHRSIYLGADEQGLLRQRVC